VYTSLQTVSFSLLLHYLPVSKVPVEVQTLGVFTCRHSITVHFGEGRLHVSTLSRRETSSLSFGTWGGDERSGMLEKHRSDPGGNIRNHRGNKDEGLSPHELNYATVFQKRVGRENIRQI
jgi:hypothetical protein